MASIKKRVTATGQTRWDARVRVGDKVTTKTHRTKELAQTWARNLEDAARSGELVDPALARKTLEEYSVGWLEGRRLKPRTRALYRDLLDRRILPALGDTQLRHLTAEAVRRWHVAQPDQVYTAKAYRLLRSICGTAKDDGIIKKQPCDIANAGKEQSPERPLATPAEILEVARAAVERAQVLILLAAWCGLRVGEVLGLERRHIDPLHGTVTVEQQAQWLEGRGRVIESPKTFASKRTVEVPAVVAAALEHHLEKFVGPGPDAVVAVGVRGGPLTPSMLHKYWTAARKATGLTHVTYHDLRHAAGTMVAQTGATQREIREHLGHASDRAAARYQHAATERKKVITAGLDAIAADVVPIRSREGRAMDGS